METGTSEAFKWLALMIGTGGVGGLLAGIRALVAEQRRTQERLLEHMEEIISSDRMQRREVMDRATTALLSLTENTDKLVRAFAVHDEVSRAERKIVMEKLQKIEGKTRGRASVQ